MPQPTRPGISVPHALGLFVFVATAAVLAMFLITRVTQGLGSLAAIATAFSLLVAVIACFAMAFDAVDAWVKGGAMPPHGRRMLRSLVSVALIGAVAAAVLGGNLQLMLALVPSLVIYLFIARDSLRFLTGPADRAAAGPAPAAQSASAARSRQRRGGKKRR